MLTRDPRETRMWDPGAYLAYADERTRPARDLLAAVDVADPSYVVDLGCGTGTSTQVLAARWPRAEILGLDSSVEMIAAAGDDPGGLVRYAVADVRDWRPERPVDVIFSNALFQWVPGHLNLFDAWLPSLAPGGRLAVQVPGNFDAPTHALLRQVCGTPRWRGLLGGFAGRREAAHSPAEYVARLGRAGRPLDVWETTYLHVLHGDDPVVRWVSGTALRPVLAALDAHGEGRAEFLAEYATLLRAAYPAGPAGTILPFRRIFVVLGNP
jgi:trans-aconitate 2-methyltransferase